MAYLQRNKNPTTLVHQEDRPDLSCTDPFQEVIETFPEQFPIPSSIIKLGLLSQHLETESDRYKINTEALSLESVSSTTVPPQTLAQIRWLLSNHTSNLTDTEKKKIGDLCSASGLNLPPETGTRDIEEIKTSSQASVDETVFVQQQSDKVECEHCGSEFSSRGSLNGHLASCVERPTKDQDSNPSDEKDYYCKVCDESFRKKNALRVHKKRNCGGDSSSESSSEKRPAFGKEIRKDKGSERVSGRNPFADPGKIKDTGLHQGGN